jgi:hypothetical protein
MLPPVHSISVRNNSLVGNPPQALLRLNPLSAFALNCFANCSYTRQPWCVACPGPEPSVLPWAMVTMVALGLTLGSCAAVALAWRTVLCRRAVSWACGAFCARVSDYLQDQRAQASLTRKPSYLFALDLGLCVTRVALTMVANTTVLYLVSRHDHRLWALLRVQVACVGAGLVVGVGVVVTFFRRIMQRCSEGVAGSTRRIALSKWMNRHTTALRGMKLLAVCKPGVLLALQSQMCGLDAIPVSVFYMGWRWVWVGDGVVTLIVDGTQLALTIARHSIEPGSLGIVAVRGLLGACGGVWSVFGDAWRMCVSVYGM